MQFKIIDNKNILYSLVFSAECVSDFDRTIKNANNLSVISFKIINIHDFMILESVRVKLTCKYIIIAKEK